MTTNFVLEINCLEQLVSETPRICFPTLRELETLVARCEEYRQYLPSFVIEESEGFVRYVFWTQLENIEGLYLGLRALRRMIRNPDSFNKVRYRRTKLQIYRDNVGE